MVDLSSIEQEVEYPSIGSHNNSNNNNDIWDHFDHLSQSIYSTMNAADNFREYIEESVVMNEEVETLIFVGDNIKNQGDPQLCSFVNYGNEQEEELEAKAMDEFNDELQNFLDTTCDKLGADWMGELHFPGFIGYEYHGNCNVLYFDGKKSSNSTPCMYLSLNKNTQFQTRDSNSWKNIFKMCVS